MASQDYLSARQRPERQRPQGLLFAEGYTFDETNLYLPTGNEINSDGTNKSFIILSDDNRSSIEVSKARIEQRERMINGRMRSYHIADKVGIAASWSMLPSRSFSDNPNFSSGVEFVILSVQQTDGNTKIQFATQGNHTFYVEDLVEFSGVSGIEGPQRVTDRTDNTFKISSSFSPELSSPKASAILGALQGLVNEIDLDNNPATEVLKVKLYGSKFYKDQQYTTDGGAGGNDLLTWYENHPGSFYVLLAYDKYDSLPANKYSKLNRYNQAVEVYFSDFSYSIEKRGQQSHDFWNISFSLEEV
jgi:hypothetical protein